LKSCEHSRRLPIPYRPAVLTAKRDEPLPTLRDAMRRFHFDLAGMPVPAPLSRVLSLADETQLHYGSDFPFTPLKQCQELIEVLEAAPLLSDVVRQAMFGNNARQLFLQPA
jgi:predicted TIM-barrel fold metal-dependent hydrolase